MCHRSSQFVYVSVPESVLVHGVSFIDDCLPAASRCTLTGTYVLEWLRLLTLCSSDNRKCHLVVATQMSVSVCLETWADSQLSTQLPVVTCALKLSGHIMHWPACGAKSEMLMGDVGKEVGMVHVAQQNSALSHAGVVPWQMASCVHPSLQSDCYAVASQL